jgi:acyl-CoA synthetase (AMP-forming)/AMP-acid ligase II
MPPATKQARATRTWHRREHLGYLIDDPVTLHPDRVALIGAQTAVTYGELDERSDRIAAALVRRGVRPGDRVALLWANHVEYVQTFLGVLRSGGVAVPLNTRLGDDALRSVLVDAGAVALLPGPGSEERAAELAAAAPAVRVTSTADDLVAEPCRPGSPSARAAADGVCIQAYTSGSTGRPKGVLLTHAGQLWNVDTVRRVLLLDETDRTVVAIPMFHANAAITVQVFLRAGASLVVHEAFDPAAVLRAIEEHRCTFLGGVPAMFAALVDARRADPAGDVSSLEVAMVGSADVPAPLSAAFEKSFGIPLREGYGLTEGGPYVTLTPRWGVHRRGSAGLPLPGCEIEIRSLDDATRLGADRVGQLWVRNPGVTVGYHGMEELTRERVQEGWLATGDLARVDQDGYLTLAGRADDMINISGENAYPREIEEILLGHPDVSNACVVAIPDPVKGAVPVAAIVPVPGAQLHEDALVAYFCAHGPAYARPRRVAVVDALPLLGTGKADRAAVRALFERTDR